MKTNIKDRVYKSKHGFFSVWKLSNGYGIYNNNGVRIASVCRFSLLGADAYDRGLEMAKLAADAIETKFQY